MSRQYSDPWRPPQNSRPVYHNSRGAYTNVNSFSRRPGKDWDNVNNLADDQIAPKSASRSTSSLQRWALATADLPQQAHRSNETQIIERIERRYGGEGNNPNAPFPRYSNAVHEAREQSHPGSPNDHSGDSMYGYTLKRPLSISPHPRGRAPPHGQSAISYMRDTKRRRTRSPSPARHRPSSKVLIDLTVESDVNYEQSSGWGFPGSGTEGIHK